jgi:hypothetical protein
MENKPIFRLYSIFDQAFFEANRVKHVFLDGKDLICGLSPFGQWGLLGKLVNQL